MDSPPTEQLAEAMLDYADAVSDCVDMDDLRRLAIAAVGRVGMTVVAVGMITGRLAESGRLMLFHNWPDAWLAHYNANGYMEIDPLPRWALVSGATARWSDVLATLGPSDPGHRIAADAAGFGFRDGAVVPVRTQDGALGLVSVGGPGAAMSRASLHYIHSICSATLHRADALAGQGDPARSPPMLSRREQECVSLLALGLNEREIAEHLNIRGVTVRFHLDNARIKTGAKSRTHLAGIAGQWLGRRRAPLLPGQ